jgi:hypothetical protein
MKGLKLNYIKMSKYNVEIDILCGNKNSNFLFLFFLDFFFQNFYNFFWCDRPQT